MSAPPEWAVQRAIALDIETDQKPYEQFVPIIAEALAAAKTEGFEDAAGTFRRMEAYEQGFMDEIDNKPEDPLPYPDTSRNVQWVNGRAAGKAMRQRLKAEGAREVIADAVARCSKGTTCLCHAHVWLRARAQALP